MVGTWHKYFPTIITFIWPFFDNYNFSLEEFWGFSARVAPSSLFLMKYLKHSKTIQIIWHLDLTNVSILPHCSLSLPLTPCCHCLATRQLRMEKQRFQEESGFENLSHDLHFLDKWAQPWSSKITKVGIQLKINAKSMKSNIQPLPPFSTAI